MPLPLTKLSSMNSARRPSDQMSEARDEAGYGVLGGRHCSEDFALPGGVGDVAAGLEPVDHCGHVFREGVDRSEDGAHRMQEPGGNRPDTDPLPEEPAGNLSDVLQADRSVPPISMRCPSSRARQLRQPGSRQGQP